MGKIFTHNWKESLFCSCAVRSSLFTILFICFISSVQSLSCVWLFATPWTAACQASLSINNSQSLFKLLSIESMMPSNHLILCHLLLLVSQHQGLFKWVSSSHQGAKVLEFQPQHQLQHQDWFSLGLTGWISLLSKGLSGIFSNTAVQKHQFLSTQLSL